MGEARNGKTQLFTSPRIRMLVNTLLILLATAVTVRYAVIAWLRTSPASIRYPVGSVTVLTDFRDTVMLPARAIAEHVNPYDIAVYTRLFPFAQEFDPYMPWWLSATAPIGNMGWSTAYLVYSCVLAAATSACAAGAGVVIARSLRRNGVHAWLPLPGIVAAAVIWEWLWRPTTYGQGLGNVGAVAALAAFLALTCRSTAWGAIMLAIAWVKPQYGIPLVIAMLVCGRWLRAVSGTVLAGAASIPMIVKLSADAGGFPALVGSVLRSTASLGDRSSASNADALSGRIDLYRWFDLAGFHSGLVPMALGTVLLVLSVRLGVALCRRGRPAAAALLVSMAVLLAFPHIHYDLAMAAPAAAWTLVEAASRIGSHQWRTDITIIIASAVLVASCLVPIPNALLAGALTLAFLAMLVWAFLAVRQSNIPADEVVVPA